MPQAHDSHGPEAEGGIIGAIARDLANTDGELVHAEVQAMVVHRDPDGQESVDYTTQPYGVAPIATRLGLLDIAREKLRRGLFS